MILSCIQHKVMILTHNKISPKKRHPLENIIITKANVACRPIRKTDNKSKF